MRPRSAKRRSFRPRVEALETRALLSVCTVDRLTDVGEGKGMAGDLRYCITQAQDGDSIQFGVTGTINLRGALPDLARSINIEGPGASLLRVRRDAGSVYRIFTVRSAVTVLISGLTISNGADEPGGGINNGGTLMLIGATVSGNRGNASGGGILNAGTMTVSACIISNNYLSDSTQEGGGIYNGGHMTVLNSTISGNVADAGELTALGGGVLNTGVLTAINSTITGNRAGCIGKDCIGQGGGIFSVGTLAMHNTILAGNTAPAFPDGVGHLTSSGYNLIGNTEGGSGFVATDLLNVNPLLGPLQDNGGPTQTHALLPGSPAIDAGDSTDAPKFDQRGLPRITGNVLDIGAYEVLPGPVAAFLLAAPQSAVAGVPFDLSVLAYDADGYLATNYTGTVAFFSSTDPDAMLPEPYTFTKGDAGVMYLPESAMLFAEGLQEVGVYDVETFAGGLAYVEVFPGSAPGGAPNLPWTSWPDTAALLALLSQQPRVRP